MVLSMNKIIGTICPYCGSISKTEIGPFHIMNEFDAVCESCKHKIINIKRETRTKNYKVSQNCFLCGENHIFGVSHKSMWKREMFSLGCTESGFDMCYLGAEPEVDDALDRLIETLESMADDDGEPGELPQYTAQALEIIKKMLAEQRILCLCGEEKIVIRLEKDGFLICCDSCGAEEFISCATKHDIELLNKRKSVLLR